MGYVVDKWTDPAPAGGRRPRNNRWGHGRRWLARWTDPDGHTRSRAFASKDAAEAHLTEQETRARSGLWVAPSKTTFRELAETWLVEQVHLRDSSAAGAAYRLRSSYDDLGDRRISDITRGDVQALVVAQSKTLAPATVHLTYTYVAAVLEHAARDRLIAKSPCQGVKLPKVDKPPVAPLTPEQVWTVADRMIDEHTKNGRRLGHFRAMILVGAATGLRPGELRGLTWDRVTKNGIRVDRQLTPASGAVPVFGPPKTESSVRTVPLAASTRTLLERLHEERGEGPERLVFFRPPNAALTRTSLQYAWEVATEGMGLPDRSGWHMLRHHHASLLIAAGLSPRAVADRLGHKDVAETLRTYSHLWPTDQERALAAIEDVYGGLREVA